MTYYIRNWSTHFEVAQSRKISQGKPLSWVATPTKLGGKGRTRLLRSRNGESMLGAWCSCIQLAARMPVRGVFADHDGPLDAADIADSIGFSVETVQAMLDACISPKIKWLGVKLEDGESDPVVECYQTATTTVDDGIPTLQDITEQNIDLPPTAGANKNLPDPRLIVDWWNGFAPALGLRSVERFTENRRAKCKTRLGQGIEGDLPMIQAKIEGSTMLLGDNDRGWKVDMDFVINSEQNVTKILEGKYDNPGGTNGNGKSHDAAFFAKPENRKKWVAAGMEIPDEYRYEFEADEMECES